MTNYISREDYMKFLEEGFTYGALNRLAEFIVLKSVEEMLQTLPVVISHLVGSAAVMKGLADQFYKDNKDLAEHRLIVAKVIEGIEAENPGSKLEEVFRKAAPVARAQIAKATQIENTPVKGRKEMDQELGVL